MTFPTNLLSPNQKALSLFSAAFGGMQDVHYLRQAGIKDITLVDNDQEKLLKMALDADWVKFDDCFEFIDKLLTTTQKYDIITSDQWTNQDKLIHEDYLSKLKALCKGWLILGISQTYLNTLPLANREVIIHNPYPLLQRSSRNGGVYWRIIDCRSNVTNDDLVP